MIEFSFLTLLYLASAGFGAVFLYYLFKILAEARLIGERPMSWIVLATGLAMIATSSVIELVFVSRPVLMTFNAFNMYFTIGNLLVLPVLVAIWRSMEG